MKKLLTSFAIIGFAFVVGYEFAKKEACEESGKVWEYDLGVCK